MAEFTPEYIELCKQAKLTRRFQQGDFYWAESPGDVRYQGTKTRVFKTPLDRLQAGAYPVSDTDYPEYTGPCYWLPQEGDLLDLLEAEGCQGVEVWRTSEGDIRVHPAMLSTHPQPKQIHGPDRRTAFLRLLLVVREEQS